MREALAPAVARVELTGSPLAVAYSGGLDSTVLLHAARARLNPSQVLALHVHHGLQPAADAFAAHCARQAERLGLELVAMRASGAPGAGENIEQWARTQRYRLLLEAARERRVAALLTAHHADDQLETVLLALARGCGLDGLLGIEPQGDRDGVRLIRPLLGFDRRALDAFARSHGLVWIEDPSNADLRFRRNAVRARLLPVLEAVLPGMAGRLPATLEVLREAQAQLQAQASADLEAARRRCPAGQTLDRGYLAELPVARRHAALRAWLVSLGERVPTRAKLFEIARQLVLAPGPHGLVTHGDCRLLRDQDRLWAIAPAAVRALEAFDWVWTGAPGCELPGSGQLGFEQAARGLDPSWLSGRRLRIAPVAGSVRLRTRPTGPRRSVKNLRQELGLPAALRGAFPGVWTAEGSLLYVAPFGMDESPSLPWAEPGIRLTWRGTDPVIRLWDPGALGAGATADR